MFEKRAVGGVSASVCRQENDRSAMRVMAHPIPPGVPILQANTGHISSDNVGGEIILQHRA